MHSSLLRRSYFLFAASLIMLSNEFFGLFNVENYETCMEHTVTIMKYCAETDPQAERLLYILTEFRAVVAEKGQFPRRASASIGPKISSTPTSAFDSTANLPGVYDNPTSRSSSAYDVASMGEPKLSHPSRHNSMASMAVPAPAPSEASSSRSSAIPSPTVVESTAMQMAGLTPPHSSNSVSMAASQNVEYYPLPTPGPAALEQHPTEPLGDASVIDFDSFWQWPLNGMSGTPGMPPVGPPTSHGFSHPMGGPSFAAFSIDAPGHGGGGGGIGIVGNIPMYPPSNFV